MINEIYNIPNQNWMNDPVFFHFVRNLPFHIWIPLYFYFTGLSAGSFIVSSLYSVFKFDKFRPLALPAAIFAILLLVGAMLCLILDMENPMRFYYVLVPWFFNPKSPVSYGAWLFVIYPLVCSIYAWYLHKKDPKKYKVLGIITIPLALSVHAYTGFFFAVIKAREYWYTALMPGYFITSAILSGIALLCLLVIFEERWVNIIPTIGEDKGLGGLLSPLSKIMTVIIPLELFWAFSYFVVMLYGPEEGSILAKVTLHDPIFYVGEIGLGMIIPLFLLNYSKTKDKKFWVGLSSILILIGVLIMRCTLVFKGFYLPLT